MLKHYIKILVPNLSKQKVLAFINVFGLSAGTASFCLFLLFAVNELNFDKFHENANNIYRIYEWHEGMNGGDGAASTSVAMPLGYALKQDLADVVNAVRFRYDHGESLVRIEKNIHRESLSYADP